MQQKVDQHSLGVPGVEGERFPKEGEETTWSKKELDRERCWEVGQVGFNWLLTDPFFQMLVLNRFWLE